MPRIAGQKLCVLGEVIDSLSVQIFVSASEQVEVNSLQLFALACVKAINLGELNRFKSCR